MGVTAVEMVTCTLPETDHNLAENASAVNKVEDFGWLFRRCCEPKSARRPSCRGLRVALASIEMVQKLEVEKKNQENRRLEGELRLARTERLAATGTDNAVLGEAQRILKHGLGPYAPCKVAVRLLRRTAERDDPVDPLDSAAMCELACCLFCGRGVTIDEAGALQLWRTAAAAGHVESNGHLALAWWALRRIWARPSASTSSPQTRVIALVELIWRSYTRKVGVSQKILPWRIN
eukprot:m.189296 g.189296  ORF g.189296 m.189296 type:complete len:235 (+) comp15106_c0_seq2:1076-1780(+)